MREEGELTDRPTNSLSTFVYANEDMFVVMCYIKHLISALSLDDAASLDGSETETLATQRIEASSIYEGNTNDQVDRAVVMAFEQMPTEEFLMLCYISHRQALGERISIYLVIYVEVVAHVFNTPGPTLIMQITRNDAPLSGQAQTSLSTLVFTNPWDFLIHTFLRHLARDLSTHAEADVADVQVALLHEPLHVHTDQVTLLHDSLEIEISPSTAEVALVDGQPSSSSSSSSSSSERLPRCTTVRILMYLLLWQREEEVPQSSRPRLARSKLFDSACGGISSSGQRENSARPLHYAVEDGRGPLSIQQRGQANGQRNNAGERGGRGGNGGVQSGRRERPEQPLSLGGNQNGRGERGPQPLHFERHVRNDKSVLVEAPRRNHQVQYEGRYGSWSGYTEEIGERQLQAQTRASQNGWSAPVIIPSPAAAGARPSQQPRLSGLLNSTTSNSVASSSNSNSSPPLSSTSTNPQANIDDDDKPLRLHFGGLAFGTTCARIVELCAPYGEVFDPYVPKQRNGRLMPMAFYYICEWTRRQVRKGRST